MHISPAFLTTFKLFLPSFLIAGLRAFLVRLFRENLNIQFDSFESARSLNFFFFVFFSVVGALFRDSLTYSARFHSMLRSMLSIALGLVPHYLAASILSYGWFFLSVLPLFLSLPLLLFNLYPSPVRGRVPPVFAIPPFRQWTAGPR